MRIISGSAGGRKLKTPGGNDIRPTSDKVRGAIFNSLLSKIDITGARIVDCFCGSGALGLEALSRGAAHCTFVDNARASLELAKENAKNLGLDAQADFIFSDASKLKAAQTPAQVVFLDPPYNKNLLPGALAALHAGGWLAPGAICVAETEKTFHEIPAPFDPLDEKIYGDTKVLFLRYSP